MKTDHTRYLELQDEIKVMIFDRDISNPKLQVLWKESEEIKNRNGGMPPQPSNNSNR